MSSPITPFKPIPAEMLQAGKPITKFVATRLLTNAYGPHQITKNAPITLFSGAGAFMNSRYQPEGHPDYVWVATNTPAIVVMLPLIIENVPGRNNIEIGFYAWTRYANETVLVTPELDGVPGPDILVHGTNNNLGAPPNPPAYYSIRFGLTDAQRGGNNFWIKSCFTLKFKILPPKVQSLPWGIAVTGAKINLL